MQCPGTFRISLRFGPNLEVSVSAWARAGATPWKGHSCLLDCLRSRLAGAQALARRRPSTTVQDNVPPIGQTPKHWPSSADLTVVEYDVVQGSTPHCDVFHTVVRTVVIYTPSLGSLVQNTSSGRWVRSCIASLMCQPADSTVTEWLCHYEGALQICSSCLCYVWRTVIHTSTRTFT